MTAAFHNRKNKIDIHNFYRLSLPSLAYIIIYRYVHILQRHIWLFMHESYIYIVFFYKYLCSPTALTGRCQWQPQLPATMSLYCFSTTFSSSSKYSRLMEKSLSGTQHGVSMPLISFRALIMDWTVAWLVGLMF